MIWMKSKQFNQYSTWTLSALCVANEKCLSFVNTHINRANSVGVPIQQQSRVTSCHSYCETVRCWSGPLRDFPPLQPQSQYNCRRLWEEK